MSKSLKPTLVFCAIALLLLTVFLFSHFSKKPEVPALAQTFYGGITCDEPIPIGEATEDTIKLMDDVFQEYQKGGNSLRSAIQDVQGIVAALSESPEEVCNFAECTPNVTDTGPDFKLKASAVLWKTQVGGLHLPLCDPKEGSGLPCPDLSEYLEGLEALKGTFKSGYQNIRDLFEKETVSLTEDIRKSSDPSEKDSITKPEAVRRKVELARAWLSPSISEKKSCALSERERAQVDAGELGKRFPMRCDEALAEGIYWPRPWSEGCEEECKRAPTEACRKCLGKDPGQTGSVLAKINYRIYGVCEGKCVDEFSQECVSCLCEGLSGDECTVRVCGDSNNWVCCHETLLEEREAIPLVTPLPSEPGVAGDCTGKDCGEDISNLCGQQQADCCQGEVSNYEQEIQNAVQGRPICPGVDTEKLVKAIMAKESCGDITMTDGISAGLMQLVPDTANDYKANCGVSEDITLDWLKKEENAQAQICIAIEYLKTLVSNCGCEVRHLAAGYNGGGANACDESTNCGQGAAAEGGQCSMCLGTYTRRWECLWDDNQHTLCNKDKPNNFSPTRKYVPMVNYCYNQF